MPVALEDGPGAPDEPQSGGGRVGDPCRNLRIITWNVGTVRNRLGLIRDLLLTRTPHLLLLQETRLTTTLEAVLKGELRDLGYLLYADKSSNLAAIVRRGWHLLVTA